MSITVIGMPTPGIVASGVPARESHHVTGLDLDGSKIERLGRGERATYEPGLDAWLTEGVPRGQLHLLRMEEFNGGLGDAALIATGTPASESGEVDLCQVVSALRWIRGRQPGNTAIVMKSIVPPGSGRIFA